MNLPVTNYLSHRDTSESRLVEHTHTHTYTNTRWNNQTVFKGAFVFPVLNRVEKEREALKVDMRSARTEISNLREEIEEAKQEEKRLRQTIRQANMDIGRRQKDIDSVMNEKDILGTQLVRRNDELGLQYGRIKVRFNTQREFHNRLEAKIVIPGAFMKGEEKERERKGYKG